MITRYRADSMWKARRYSNADAHRRLAWHPHVGLDQALDSRRRHCATVT